MNLAERFEQKGIEKGIEKGRQEGMQQGRQEGMEAGHYAASCQIARQLLASGINRQIVKKSTGLSDEAINGLTKLD